MSRRCDRCEWWIMGECREGPPSRPAPFDYPPVWPRTLSHDWCGRFRPAEREIQAASMPAPLAIDAGEVDG